MINLKNEKQKLSFLRLRGASGAQGISDTASCREAHKRRFLFNSWILHFAYAQPLKMTVLVFLLSLNLSESRAAWSDNCPSGTAGTTCKTCGDNCAYTENSEHVVTIYGSGEIDYDWKTVNGKEGYYDANNNPNPFNDNKSITGVQFAKGSNFTTIGEGAFSNASRLTSITIPEGVTSIGRFAFYCASSLTSITIPKGVTSLGDYTFAGASRLTSITLPGSLTSVGSNLFNRVGNLTEINCAGTVDECNALEDLLDEEGYLSGRTFKRVEPVKKCSSYTSSGCNACYAGYAYGNRSCHACGTGKNCHWDEDVGVVFDGCKDNYLRKENECVASSQGCGANFRLNDGECDRLRYTPAEAAKVLKDDNNSVTITFKK